MAAYWLSRFPITPSPPLCPWPCPAVPRAAEHEGTGTMLQLRHLRNFKILAEELNYTRAARKANISQSSLSEQIMRLEDIIG